MEEEEKSRALPEGVGHPIVGVSPSSGHETSTKGEEQEDMFAASDSFCSAMCAMISKPDIEKMGQIQLETLTRFQGMNATFSEFNRHSFDQYEKLHLHFQNHTRMIVDMKKDLDIIFRRIRNLKTKLTKQYGGAFAVTMANIQKLEEEIEAEQEGNEEEKPQTLQQESPPSDHYKNTYSDDVNTSRSTTEAVHLQGESLPEAENAPQENDTACEKQTFEKPWKQEGEAQIRPVLRPQLSSSDENYSDKEPGDIAKEQMVNKCLSQGVQGSVLRPQLNSSDGSYSADKADQDKKSVQDDRKSPEKKEKLNLENSGKVNYRTTLRPEISSSDESLEDDIDDVSDESNTGGCISTSPSSEEEGRATQISNNEDLQVQDGNDKES